MVLKVFEDVLSLFPVFFTWVVSEHAQVVHCVGDGWSSSTVNPEKRPEKLSVRSCFHCLCFSLSLGRCEVRTILLGREVGRVHRRLLSVSIAHGKSLEDISYVAIYIDLQRPPWPVANDFHAEEVMQFAEVIHLVVRLDAIDNSFDGSAASSGDHTVVHVRENVDRMSIPISEGRFYGGCLDNAPLPSAF